MGSALAGVVLGRRLVVEEHGDGGSEEGGVDRGLSTGAQASSAGAGQASMPSDSSMLSTVR